MAASAASRDKVGAPTSVDILGVASGAPIGETDGVCGGGIAASDTPLALFESGTAPLAVGVFGGAVVVGRTLGALDAFGTFVAPGTELLGAALGWLLGALGTLVDAPAL